MRSRQPFLENIIWAEMLISTNRLPMGMAEGRTDIHEIRLMGLILAQSIGVGFAIALFDAGIWLNDESVHVQDVLRRRDARASIILTYAERTEWSYAPDADGVRAQATRHADEATGSTIRTPLALDGAEPQCPISRRYGNRDAPICNLWILWAAGYDGPRALCTCGTTT